MPPASSRKTRARKQPEHADRSDADDPATANATPSRKRRKVSAAENAVSPNGTEPNVAPSSTQRQRRYRQADIQVYEDDTNFAEDTAEELVNSVIRGLRLPKYQVQAQVDFSNEVQQAEHPEGKQAYAKIAGNGWTFYVEELSVRLGRPAEERNSVPAHADSEEPPSLPDKSLVHIDLGPSKLVSRVHAEIVYEEKSGQWQLHVAGRNGAKLDERPLKRSDRAFLHSGSVIEIADTQMMFITPNVEPEIHPAIRDAARARFHEDEEDEDDVDLMPPPAPDRTPTRNNGSAPRGDETTRAAPPSQQPSHKYVAKGQYAAAAHPDSSGDSRFPSSATKAKSTPAYPRTMLLDTNEDIDYAQDSAKDLKPPHSYAQLIGMAILSTPEEKMTLAKIYDWIKERYAFYRLNGGGWQNSIRHNLSLNKSFEKVARRTDEPGKGMKWQIVPDQKDDFMKKSFSSVRKASGRSSLPGSPMKDPHPSSALGDDPFSTTTKHEHGEVKPMANPFGVKNSPGSTPPMAHYPSIKSQAYTPERSGRFTFMAGGVDSSPRNGLYGLSPFPLRSEKKAAGFNDLATSGSPSGPSMFLNSDEHSHLQTPLISKAPRLAPPSTARLPSQFMPMSSPAPFWKYADFSTPARIDSPVKTEHPPAARGERDVKSVLTKEPIRSSSPPLPEAEVGRGSPTKDLSSRGMERVVSSQARQPSPPKHARSLMTAPSQPTPGSPATRNAAAAAAAAASSPPRAPAAAEESSDEEEGMIDLAKGFQPIGKFHTMGAVRGS